jgi:glycosyltransferase involved in cell wall biosynthesis
MTAPSRIDQCMAGFAVGDATSNAALLIQAALRSMGYDSDIFAPAAQIMPAARDLCRPLEDHPGRPQDIVIHHFGIWSEAADYFMHVPGKRILYYHNITPGPYFRGYDDALAKQLDDSRQRLGQLIDSAVACWAVSAFNAKELADRGADSVQVLPLPYAPDQEQPSMDKERFHRLAAPLTNLLTVGRVAPNKQIERIIKAFAAYQRTHNPFSRLFIVGSLDSVPRYSTYLRCLTHELGVRNVCFEGFVWPDALATYYRLAHAFVSTSDHEGYCLPLLEAMAHDVPVFARHTGGTPEALGGAGVELSNLDPAAIALTWHAVLASDKHKWGIIHAQRQRIQHVKQRTLTTELNKLIDRCP